jgi:hypothetical protein
MGFGYYPSAWDMGELEQLTGTEMLVLLAIVEHTNNEGVSWPSQQRLAQWARVSPRTVRRVLRRLEDICLIHRTKRWAEHGGGRTSDLIHLLFPQAPGRSDTVTGMGQGVEQSGHSPYVQPDNVAREPRKNPSASKERGSGKKNRNGVKVPCATEAVRGETRGDVVSSLPSLSELEALGLEEDRSGETPNEEIWDYTDGGGLPVTVTRKRA